MCLPTPNRRRAQQPWVLPLLLRPLHLEGPTQREGLTQDSSPARLTLCRGYEFSQATRMGTLFCLWYWKMETRPAPFLRSSSHWRLLRAWGTLRGWSPGGQKECQERAYWRQPAVSSQGCEENEGNFLPWMNRRRGQGRGSRLSPPPQICFSAQPLHLFYK